jgi:hypothetical protein
MAVSIMMLLGKLRISFAHIRRRACVFSLIALKVKLLC